MLSVTHYYREPRPTGLSIEGIFGSVKADLEGRVKIRDFHCSALRSRLGNTLQAPKYASDINHITGDVNFLALGLRGRRNMLTIHDFGYYENPIHNKVKHLFYKTMWFTLPLKYIGMVTVVSAFTKEKLLKYFHYPESRVRVIPDPVKPVFRFAERERPNTQPVVLMLGTGKHKNLDGLIEAAHNENFHLDIVGWPPIDELARMQQYNISFKVYNKLTDEEVFERYRQCDILYIASFYEGFGMPIIEAQAVGRPVVTSNLGAMKEVGQNSALLVDPADPRTIRTALNALASDNALYYETVTNGLQNAARYHHAQVSEKYFEAYNDFFATHQPS